MCANDLKLGEKAFILSIIGDQKFAKRLSALGFTEGCLMEAESRAPFGDPIVFLIRGASIAIRIKDAMNILVDKG